MDDAVERAAEASTRSSWPPLRFTMADVHNCGRSPMFLHFPFDLWHVGAEIGVDSLWFARIVIQAT